MEVKKINTTVTDPSDKLFGYSNFNDVTDPVLRAWNRLNTIYNIKERFKNKTTWKAYVEQFIENDLYDVLKTGLEIRRLGYETVRREMMRKYNA